MFNAVAQREHELQGNNADLIRQCLEDSIAIGG